MGFWCFECVSKFWHNIDISISAVNVQSLKFFALFYFPSHLRLAPVYTIHIQTWDHKKSLSRLKFRFFDKFWDNLQVMQPKNFLYVFNKLKELTTISHLRNSAKILKVISKMLSTMLGCVCALVDGTPIMSTSDLDQLPPDGFARSRIIREFRQIAEYWSKPSLISPSAPNPSTPISCTQAYTQEWKRAFGFLCVLYSFSHSH